MSPQFWLLILVLLVAGLLGLWGMSKRRDLPARPKPVDLPKVVAEPEPDEAVPEQSEETEEFVELEDPGDPLDAIDWESERDSRAWQELAEMCEDAGRFDEAASAMQAAVASLEEDQADRAYELHRELAALYIRRQSTHEAYKHLTDACACAALCFGSPSVQQAETLDAMGELLEKQGNWAKAYDKYLEALETMQSLYGVPTDKTADAYGNMARMCERMADWSEALAHYLEAYRIVSGQAELEDVRRAYLADGREDEVFEEWLNQQS